MRVQGWRKAGAWRRIQRDGFTLDSLSAECAVWHPLWGEMALPGEWGLSPSQGPVPFPGPRLPCAGCKETPSVWRGLQSRGVVDVTGSLPKGM